MNTVVQCPVCGLDHRPFCGEGTPPTPEQVAAVEAAPIEKTAPAKIIPQYGKTYLYERTIRAATKSQPAVKVKEWFDLGRRERRQLERAYEEATGKTLTPRQLKKLMRAQKAQVKAALAKAKKEEAA